jgi:hypothetical protein
MHGVFPTPPNGGLAAQVSASFAKKYDGTVNPTKFLQIYSTSILAAGENEDVMANYFPVVLTGTA